MKRKFRNLFGIIAAAVRGAAGWRPPGNVQLPSPWESWTIIGLLRQRDRRAWGHGVVADRVDRSVRAGTVPGLPEWEYRFYGGRCWLTHKVTGEQIETETGEGFDFFSWIRNLASLRNPGPDLRRMVELHPSLQSLRVTLAGLRDADVIDADREAVHYFSVAEEAVAYSETVSAFCRLWDDATNRKHLSEAIGDAGDADAVRRQRAKRVAEVTRRYEGSEQLRVQALYAFADLGGEELSARLQDALGRRPWSDLACAALKVIAARNDPGWCEGVYRVFREVTPPGEYPQPAIWERAVAFLLRHGFRKEEILAELPLAGPAALGEAAILGLEYGNSPPTALFRRALLSPVAAPLDRETAAAALAVLDLPWSRDLLLSVLRESGNPEVTAESRAALRECRGPEGAAAADAWEDNHPAPEPESLPDPARYVRGKMEDLQDRVWPLRRRFA
jgi:hypothetical protein